MMMNVPNFLTLLRIAAIPVIVVIYYLPFHMSHTVVAILFAIAAFTDWLDGYLARNLQQGTKFGAVFDSIADKLIVAISLVLVVGELGGGLLAVPAAIIVGREIVISGLREWMAEIGKRTSVAVNRVAKIKTAIQMISLFLLLIYTPNVSGEWILWLGYLSIYVAALLTLWTMIMYLKAAWPDLIGDHQ